MNRHLVVRSITQVHATEQNVHVYHAVLAVVLVDAKPSIVQGVKVFLILVLNHAPKAEAFLTGTALHFQTDLANQPILSLFGFSLLLNKNTFLEKEEVLSNPLLHSQ